MVAVPEVEPAIITPAAGATLAGEIEVFTWQLAGRPIEEALLLVGSTLGGSQYARKQVGTRNEASVGGLPTDGSPVFFRVWYRTNDRWLALDRQYVAATASGLPAITRPTPGSDLAGEEETFEWDFGTVPVSNVWLYLGSEPAGFDLGARQSLEDPVGTSLIVDELPTDGRTVHVRFFYLVADAWYFSDETFTAASVEPPTRDELARELQRLVGVTADGIVGPQTRAALNQNWLGNPDSFDASFAARFTNDADLVRWVQRRIVTRSRVGLDQTGTFDSTTEAAVVQHLDRGGVVAAESFVTLLDAG